MTKWIIGQLHKPVRWAITTVALLQVHDVALIVAKALLA